MGGFPCRFFGCCRLRQGGVAFVIMYVLQVQLIKICINYVDVFRICISTFIIDYKLLTNVD